MRARATDLFSMATLLVFCHPWVAHGFRMPPSPCAGARSVGAPPEGASMCRREAVAWWGARAAAAAAAVAGSGAGMSAAVAAAAIPSGFNAVPVPQVGQVPGLFQNAKGYGKSSFTFLSRRAAG
jgi:hypothetical protein